MRAKQLKEQGTSRAMAATKAEHNRISAPSTKAQNSVVAVESPADYPLGSVQSRAIARAWLDAKNPVSREEQQRDEDALLLYDMQRELYGQVYPDYSVTEKLPIIIRGTELRLQRYGPITPAHECSGWSEWTVAKGEFVHAFGREPKFGDLLRWEHVRVMRGPELYEAKIRPQIAAWNRRIPHLVCPVKFENGRLFKRNRKGDWFEEVSASWQYHWAKIQNDADVDSPECFPESLMHPGGDVDDVTVVSIEGVTFLGVVDGKHACRPATKEELHQTETDEFFRGLLCQEPPTAPPPGDDWIRHKGSGYFAGVPVATAMLLTEGPDAEYTRFDFRNGYGKTARAEMGQYTPEAQGTSAKLKYHSLHEFPLFTASNINSTDGLLRAQEAQARPANFLRPRSPREE